MHGVPKMPLSPCAMLPRDDGTWLRGDPMPHRLNPLGDEHAVLHASFSIPFFSGMQPLACIIFTLSMGSSHLHHCSTDLSVIMSTKAASATHTHTHTPTHPSMSCIAGFSCPLSHPITKPTPLPRTHIYIHFLPLVCTSPRLHF
jgi:hypothetical protein